MHGEVFEKKHPKAGKMGLSDLLLLCIQYGCVTIFQYLVFTIMPHILGKGLAGN